MEGPSELHQKSQIRTMKEGQTEKEWVSRNMKKEEKTERDVIQTAAVTRQTEPVGGRRLAPSCCRHSH